MDTKWLKKHGWHTWYHDNYWVHPESVADSRAQDYTNYGMRLEEAIKYEKLGKPKHKSIGLPEFSRLEMVMKTKGLTKKPESR